MGGGFGGGHMGGFGGGHIGAMGGGRIGGVGGDHIGGLGGGRVDGLGAGRMAHVGHEHFGVGRRRFVGGGLYGDGFDCPYYRSHTWPYSCTY
jgi:hypothetical protein